MEGVRLWNGAIPLLHISAHGGESGIQLTDQRQTGAYVNWHQLAELLRPTHQSIVQAKSAQHAPSVGLGVCFSTCGGAHGRRMAEVMNPANVPLACILGSRKEIDIRDAALAFAVFYRGIHRGDSEQDLIAAVRAASGISDFHLEFGHFIQKQFSVRISNLLQSLQQHHKQAPPNV